MTEDKVRGTLMFVGLGNPGRSFRKNRHNIGFMLIDRFAEGRGIRFTKTRNRALLTDLRVGGQKLLLVKPQTFMNESGRAVAPLVAYHRIPISHLLVVFDDLDLPLGALRMRPFGGSSGHQGMRSLIQALDTQEFPRLRLGIGRPPGRMDPADYVLQDFKPAEFDQLDRVLTQGVECLCTFVTSGIEAAMTRFNQTPD